MKQKTKLPDGIVSGNGRIEGKLVDVAAKEPLRVEGDPGLKGRPGQTGRGAGQLDTVTLASELAEANASVQAAQERLAVARASITKQKSEIALASTEVNRSNNLVKEGAGSQRELDVQPDQAGHHPGHAGGVGGHAADRHPGGGGGQGHRQPPSRRASTTPR